MAELTNRLEREAELARIVRRMGQRHAAELAQYMKTAKRLTDIPQEFWDRVKKEMRENDELAAIMLLLWGESAVQHFEVKRLSDNPAEQIDLLRRFKGDAHRSGEAYVQKRIKQIIPGFMRHSKDMTRTAIRDIQDGADPRKRIDDAVNSVFGDKRAKTIGDTEGNLAMIDGGRFGVKKLGIETIGIWAHSRLRPSGHSNAAKKPCPICSPREGLPEGQWGKYQPGHGHSNCDCLILEIDRDGNVIGDDGTFSDTLERFGDRLPKGWLNKKTP